MKMNSKKIISLAIVSFIFLVYMTACVSGGLPKNIEENQIYPQGTIIKAKVIDTSNNEKTVLLEKQDTEFLVHTLKISKKEISKSGYDSGLVELNITFTDSVIQLIRQDDEYIYYVFHNNKINGICYRIQSKDLSRFILSKVDS
jgi:hypothetical protein